MQFGLSNEDIDKIKVVLAKFTEIERVLIYGSRAKGTYKPASDIDLTLVGENLTLTTVQAIEHEIDDLLLPYKFDISIFHHISNPDLIAHINRVGVVFI
jgi:type I restriction enzyme S subunit